MKISEKQLMQLISIAQAYTSTMFKAGEYKNVEIAQDLLTIIYNQQSEELMEIDK